MTSVSLISSNNNAKPVVDPLDALAERLLDPKTADALNTLLDHVDLLATLVSGLDAMISRGDVITDSLGSGLAELRSGNSAQGGGAIELLSALGALTRPEVVSVLSAASVAVAEGSATAKAESAKPGGIRGLLKAVKDPEVSRTLGFVVAIAKAFGRQLDK